MRIAAVMALMMCSGCAIVNGSAINEPTPFKVVLQDNKVLLFETDDAAKQHDIRRCQNAYVSIKNLGKLREILNERLEPGLRFSRIEGFFDRSVWSPATSGHYTYKGHYVHDVCQSQDLVVIESVRRLKPNGSNRKKR